MFEHPHKAESYTWPVALAKAICLSHESPWWHVYHWITTAAEILHLDHCSLLAWGPCLGQGARPAQCQ
jgi:hypothetical protein